MRERLRLAEVGRRVEVWGRRRAVGEGEEGKGERGCDDGGGSGVATKE